MGILAGDALLNLAFETAAKAFMLDMQTEQTEQQFLADMQISRKPLYEQERMRRVAQAMQILAKKAGIYGMLGGQVVDVQNEDHQQIDGETLDFIYQMKTGALIEAAMTIGAVLAGADSQEVSLLEQAARRVGVAFQIQDDILDVTSTLEELGKPVGSDEKNEKNTYVTMYGMEAAQKQVEALTQEAARCMEQLTVTNSFLNDLLLYLIRRRS